jgi:tetrapyrrole methylase family protein / MazG family protein
MNIEIAQTFFAELLSIIKKLRGPDGCPWDRKQTHETLIKFLVEESQEAIAAIEENQMAELANELGDVLLQVVLHSEIASERLETSQSDGFDIVTVLSSLCRKLKLRHPHVFGDVQVESSDEVVENWHKIKADENRNSPKTSASILGSVSPALSQLTRAYKYQIIAALAGFDWDNISDVFGKVEEELSELLCEIESAAPPANVENEMGDVFFALVNLCRFLNIHPEEALRKSNAKFYRRFSMLEKHLGGAEIMKTLSLEELDLEWDRIKLLED